MGTGTLADSHVTVPASGLSTGVTTTGGLVVIRDSVIEGSRGIWGPFNPFSSSVRRVHVRASSGIGIQRGTVAIEDALVEHNGTGDGGGIAAFGTSHPTLVTVRHSTVVGAGPAALAGVAAISNLEAATVDLRDSIVTGWQRSLQREAPGGHADIAVAYSHLAAPALYEAVGGEGAVATEHLVAGTPGFAAGYRLAAGSPFIDAGTPAPLGVTESTTDLSGAPRVVPGIAGAVAHRDLGAFEAPTVPATPPGSGGSGGSGGGPLPGAPTAGASPVALELSGRQRQRLRKRLKVHATLGADGRLRATARVKVQGRKRTLKLRRAAATVAADSPATLRLKASRKTRRIVARSLRSDRQVRIKVRDKATATDGRTAMATRKVRIRR
jgi:hypothetical protein